MHSSRVTPKGQVTIPVEIRERLGISPGDLIGFKRKDHTVELVKRKANIEESFGVVKATTGVSLNEIENAIAEGPVDDLS